MPAPTFGCPIFTGLEGEETLQIIDNFSWATGRHQWKAGAQAYQVRTIVDVTNFHDGYWEFPNDIAFDINNPASYPTSSTGTSAAWTSAPTSGTGTCTFQDTWQSATGVTLNLGLRYDYDNSVKAGNEFVDQKNAQLVSRYGGSPPLQKMKSDLNNLAPRLGSS